MHIPDGFLNVATVASTYAVSAGGVGFALRSVGRKLGEKQIPLMGVTAAFIFAAQMLNFPILGGTSGHLLGAALAAILLGPWAGLLVMSCVLLVQALLFQDGGLLALGANIFNMGVVGCLAGHLVYRGVASVLRQSRKGILAASFAAAWVTVVLASGLAALELVASGISPLEIALPAMVGVHALIGIGEGAITSAVLSFVLVARRDLLEIKRAERG